MLRTVAIFLLLTLSACGWAEWPPPPERPTAANRPEQNVFIGADAVVVGRGDTVYRYFHISTDDKIIQSEIKKIVTEKFITHLYRNK